MPCRLKMNGSGGGLIAYKGDEKYACVVGRGRFLCAAAGMQQQRCGRGSAVRGALAKSSKRLLGWSGRPLGWPGGLTYSRAR
jgi:hypothetical protein